MCYQIHLPECVDPPRPGALGFRYNYCAEGQPARYRVIVTTPERVRGDAVFSSRAELAGTVRFWRRHPEDYFVAIEADAAFNAARADRPRALPN